MSISRAVAGWYSNYGNPNSPGSRLRARRIAPLLEMIESVFRERGGVKIIDVGGSEGYWGIVSSQYLVDHKVEITIVNLPGTSMPDAHGPFRFVAADACDLNMFGDGQFDIAHSNSVVEHVGDWQRMIQFAEELSRVSERYFVQTPNYWFPIEPHCMTPFFQFLPKPVKLRLVMRFQLGHWKKADTVDDAVRIVDSARLLDMKMFRSLFEDGAISTERYFLLPKSFVAVRSKKVRASGPTNETPQESRL